VILFDGIYDLKYTFNQSARFPHINAFSWRVRIIDFSASQPHVQHIKPIGVVASPQGDGIFKTNCAETLGKNICQDFKLNVAEILWVECFSDNLVQEYVAVFTTKSYFEKDLYYNIKWRPIMQNELKAIRDYIPVTDYA
jgi:hypothetical protein